MSFERNYNLYFGISVLIVIIAFILSIISLQTYEVVEEKTVKLNPTNGIHEPLLSILNYSRYGNVKNATLYFQSNSNTPVNIIVFDYPKVYNVTVKPYSVEAIKLDRLENVIVSVSPINNSIIMSLRVTIESRPYLALSILSFILFIVGFGLTLALITYKLSHRVTLIR
ncbi:MAG TPA: hypothetical protein EYH40_03965 [Desulfurococcales archaeon]|nr:hypothetical protein [Desulfurococcales archaeon]